MCGIRQFHSLPDRGKLPELSAFICRAAPVVAICTALLVNLYCPANANLYSLAGANLHCLAGANLYCLAGQSVLPAGVATGLVLRHTRQH
jgi:hypothetical protein